MTGYQPQAGDVGFTPVSGMGGRFIRYGEKLIARSAPYQHVYLALSYTQGIQAEPGGARLFDLGAWPEAVYATPPPGVNTADVCDAALKFRGTDYSFLDYASLYLHDKQIPVLSYTIGWYVHHTRHQICSQLVAQAFEDAKTGATGLPHPPQDIDPGLFWDVVSDPANGWTIHT